MPHNSKVTTKRLKEKQFRYKKEPTLISSPRQKAELQTMTTLVVSWIEPCKTQETNKRDEVREVNVNQT